MAEYTPTTEEILDDLHKHLSPIPDGRAGAYITARRLRRSERVRWLAEHDRQVAAKALTDAVEWARSCSGESADVAADYIEEMAALVSVPSTPEQEEEQ